jgi:hypothetical protein
MVHLLENPFLKWGQRYWNETLRKYKDKEEEETAETKITELMKE